MLVLVLNISKVAFIDELYRATAQDIANNQLELEEA